MDELQKMKDFETYVQGIFNTPYGRKFFTQLAIMSDYFENSLVAVARIKKTNTCDAPLIYLESQRDLVRKVLNCLTSQQFAELRDAVILDRFPSKKKQEKEKK